MVDCWGHSGLYGGQVLRSMTLDSTYLAFEEDLKGTLTEGKLGDVVVLEADPHEVGPQEIKDIPIAILS